MFLSFNSSDFPQSCYNNSIPHLRRNNLAVACIEMMILRESVGTDPDHGQEKQLTFKTIATAQHQNKHAQVAKMPVCMCEVFGQKSTRGKTQACPLWSEIKYYFGPVKRDVGYTTTVDVDAIINKASRTWQFAKSFFATLFATLFCQCEN